jgi:hypothetical protein
MKMERQEVGDWRGWRGKRGRRGRETEMQGGEE